ncbi:MAG: hypothetical protein ACOCP8_00185 [archaeon]
MRRLIKRAEIWYHITNNKSFKYNPNYQNYQAEMGNGLYITPLEDLKLWDNLLQDREYAIPVDINNLKILDIKESPTWTQMQKELAQNGYTPADVEENMPIGITFSTEPKKIATIITWAKFKGYNAIKPILDKYEGNQIVILNNANIKFGDPIPIDELI